MPQPTWKRTARGSVPTGVRHEVLSEPWCWICGGTKLEIEGETWVVDHVIPLSRGGADERHNMRKAHGNTCNAWKSDRILDERLRQQIARRRRVELFVQD